jgi:hypothetical protein
VNVAKKAVEGDSSRGWSSLAALNPASAGRQSIERLPAPRSSGVSAVPGLTQLMAAYLFDLELETSPSRRKNSDCR